MLLMKFLFGSKHVPGGVELFVLAFHGTGFRLVFCGEGIYIGVEFRNLFVLRGDVCVFGIEFCLKFFNLAVFGFQFFVEVFDSCLQFRRIEAAFLELFLKFCNTFLIELHGALDKRYVFHYIVFSIGFAAVARDVHTSFCLVDFAETLLDIVECAHDIVQLIVFLIHNVCKRIDGALRSKIFLLLFVAVAARCQNYRSEH